MSQRSDYRRFSYKGANFRILSDKTDAAIAEIVQQRRVLSDHIRRQPEFLSSLTPIPLLPESPPIARRMHEASVRTGIGPMAAVAGVTAQMAAEAALAAGALEAVVENGGDIYLSGSEGTVIGLYAGNSPLSGTLGLAVDPEDMPLSVCSSSGRMGHSLSMSDCDLATVASKDAALADAAATLACNLTTDDRNIDTALEQVMEIPGIHGLLIIRNDRIGMAGRLPRLVKYGGPPFSTKITRDKDSPVDL